MSAATWPREDPLGERLLVIDPAEGRFRDAAVRDLPAALRPGDLVVVNDAATLPASLPGKTEAGAPVEVRLATRLEEGVWTCLLFGAGDWHTRTEDRAAPPEVAPGDRLVFDPSMAAVVRAVRARRLVDLEFQPGGAAFLRGLYRLGRPIQYAYLERSLPLWAVQTRYASRPWAVEMPSAGRPLTWPLLQEIRARGVEVVGLTHAAGLSSTGDPALDAALPFPERSDIPESTVRAVAGAHARGGRVLAVGTSVVRALEGRALLRGALASGEAETDLVIGPGFRPRVVDGLLTGMHEPTASHYALIGAFAPAPLLRAAYEHGGRAGYLHHEFGDSCLLLPGRPARRT